MIKTTFLKVFGALVRAPARLCGFDIVIYQPNANYLNALSSLLQHRDRATIFDVGAHKGESAIEFAKAFPGGRVFAFEPFGPVYSQLVENTRRCHNVSCFEFGFSDESGEIPFFTNLSTSTNSLLRLNPGASTLWDVPALQQHQRVVCNFRRIDDFVRETAIDRIHLLKLDVQGAELKVLKGAEESFGRRLISTVYLEVILAETYEGQATLLALLDFFSARRYKLVGFYNPVYGDGGGLLQCDAIFASDE